MKQMKKIVLSITAAAFVALAVVNVNLGLSGNGDFSVLSLKNIMALAQGEDNNCTNCGAFIMLSCEWTYIEYTIDASGKKIVLKREKRTCKNCAYNCDFNKPGNCKVPVLCKSNEEVKV